MPATGASVVAGAADAEPNEERAAVLDSAGVCDEIGGAALAEKKAQKKTDDMSQDSEWGQQHDPSPVEPVSKRKTRSQSVSNETLPLAEMTVSKKAKLQEAIPKKGQDDSKDDNDKTKARVFTTNFVRPMDVICGRGRPYHKHPGNVRFLAIVDAHRDMYDTASRKSKTSIAAMVVQAARSSQFGGYCEQAEGKRQNSASASASTDCDDASPVRFLRRFIRGKPKDGNANAKVETEDLILQDGDDNSIDEFDEDTKCSSAQDNDPDFDTDEVWFEVSDAVALDKASHALRSKYRTVRYSAADVHDAVQKPSKHNKPDPSRARIPSPAESQPHVVPEALTPDNQNENNKDVAARMSTDKEEKSSAENHPTRPTTSPTAASHIVQLDGTERNEGIAINQVTATQVATQAAIVRLQAESLLASQLLDAQYERARQIAHAELAHQHALAVLRVSQRNMLLGLGSNISAYGIESALRSPALSLNHTTMDQRLSLAQLSATTPLPSGSTAMHPIIQPGYNSGPLAASLASFSMATPAATPVGGGTILHQARIQPFSNQGGQNAGYLDREGSPSVTERNFTSRFM